MPVTTQGTTVPDLPPPESNWEVFFKAKQGEVTLTTAEVRSAQRDKTRSVKKLVKEFSSLLNDIPSFEQQCVALR
eukprot:2511778-Ditylum_brightwellii.AAC.1